MRELATIEVFRLVRELGKFRGYYIDKLYELGEGRFRLRLTNKGEKAYLNCALPGTLNDTTTIEKAETATGFATAFRKRTSGFVIKEITQMNRDRIINISAEKGELSINIIFELFGKGNLILTDGNMATLLTYRRQEFKDRTVAPHMAYEPPKSGTIDFTSDPAYGIKYETSNAEVARYFASVFGIGRLYVEEAITRAGDDPTAKVESVKERLPELAASIRELVKKAIGSEKAIVYMRDGEPLDFALVELAKYSGVESRACGSLNEALDAVYSSAAEARAEAHPEEAESAEAMSIRISIEKQRKSVDGLLAESEQDKRIGTIIFNNMDAINTLIRAATQDRHATAEGLLKAAQQGIKVTSVDLKNKKVVIDIGEEVEEKG